MKNSPEEVGELVLRVLETDESFATVLGRVARQGGAPVASPMIVVLAKRWKRLTRRKSDVGDDGAGKPVSLEEFRQYRGARNLAAAKIADLHAGGSGI